MRTGAAVVLLVLAAMAAARPADAQLPLEASLELRGDLALPLGDLDEVAETGWGYSVGALLQFAPAIAAYGAYNQINFGRTDGANTELVDAGFSAGLAAFLPGVITGVTPSLRGGVLFHDLDERPGFGDRTESDRGFEVGGAIDFLISPQLRVSPTISYRRYNGSFLGLVDSDVSYLTVGAGFNLYF